MKNIFILFTLLSSILFAEVDERRSDIYYGNGILTTKQEALHSLLKVLKPTILNEIYNGDQAKMDELHRFDLAYNYSAKENFDDTAIASILDLMESYQQLGNTSMGWGIAQALEITMIMATTTPPPKATRLYFLCSCSALGKRCVAPT